jgi:hypothetical protein
MIGEDREPIPVKPGQPQRIDDEYVRNGVAEIFMEVEPLNGRRHVAITEHRTRKDWALQIQQMLDERLEIHYTPKHGSWLNIAEIELSGLKGQCLDRRITDMPTMQTEVAAWEKDRNKSTRKIDWQFTTADARVKLKRPKKCRTPLFPCPR